MGYYRSWRYRDWSGLNAPSKFSILQDLLGAAVLNIRSSFLNMNEKTLDEILSDYGAIYGNSAERYARNTFIKWKTGDTKLSGQTMERLVELVPPYLSPEDRFSLLIMVLKQHKTNSHKKTNISINVKEPTAGFQELQLALNSMSHDIVLAHLSEKVMKAASWLYDDDITAARAMLAEAERLENDSIRASARKEIDLLRRTIQSGQIKAANYSVSMPAGILSVIAFTPSKCFVVTVCFGQDASQTIALRTWRDNFLLTYGIGRRFVVWYYNNGENYASVAQKYPIVKYIAKNLINAFSIMITK
jgi:hypothetical protein